MEFTRKEKAVILVALAELSDQEFKEIKITKEQQEEFSKILVEAFGITKDSPEADLDKYESEVVEIFKKLVSDFYNELNGAE